MHASAEHPSGVVASDVDGPAALTVPETARKLNISERMVWLLIKTGELKSFKVGSARRVPAEEIPAYIARQLAA